MTDKIPRPSAFLPQRALAISARMTWKYSQPDPSEPPIPSREDCNGAQARRHSVDRYGRLLTAHRVG
jgi:hypothetical protein